MTDENTQNNQAFDADNLENNDQLSLLKYAKDELGLTVRADAQASTIIKRIREATGGAPSSDAELATAMSSMAQGFDDDDDDDDDEYQGSGAYDPTLKSKLRPLHSQKKHKQLKIMITKEKGVTGADDVPVNVQGRQYLIKRGVEATVPVFIVEALRNAVETQYEEVEDGNGKRSQVVSRVPSYPLQILGEA